MNFGQAFTFIFDDKDWIKKAGYVALCQLIPILGQFIAIGFSVEIMRRVIANDPIPLPDFDFGDFLGKGFQAFVITFVYSIPMLFLILVIWAVSSTLPSMGNTDVSNVITIIISVMCGGLAILYGIFMAFIVPAALGRYAAIGTMGSAFQLGKVFSTVSKAFVPYLIAVLGALLGSIITPLGTIVCAIGVVVTFTYYYAISGHLYGQAYRQAVPV